MSHNGKYVVLGCWGAVLCSLRGLGPQWRGNGKTAGLVLAKVFAVLECMREALEFGHHDGRPTFCTSGQKKVPRVRYMEGWVVGYIWGRVRRGAVVDVM